MVFFKKPSKMLEISPFLVILEQIRHRTNSVFSVFVFYFVSNAQDKGSRLMRVFFFGAKHFLFLPYTILWLRKDSTYF